jgi:LAO/AO transport system kinase
MANREWLPPVVTTVAVKDQGTDELLEALDHHRAFLEEGDRMVVKRIESLRNRITMIVEEKLKEMFWEDGRTLEALDRMLEEVASGKKSPYRAAHELVSTERAGDVAKEEAP